MNRKFGVIASLVCLCAHGGCGKPQHNVRWIKEGPPEAHKGIYYALPKTLINVAVPITKVTTTKGSYYDAIAATKRIEVPDFSAGNPLVSFRLGVPAIETRAIPDPANVYCVELESHFLQDRDWIIELTERGLLTSADSKANDRTVETVVKTLTAVAKATMSAATKSAAADAAKVDPAKAEDALNAAMAGEIINAILDVRQRRLELASGGLRGEVDAAVFERMLVELDRIEESLMSNVRTVSISVWTFAHEFDPKKGQKAELFKYDPGKGLRSSILAIPEGFRNPDDSGSTVAVKLTEAASQSADRIAHANDDWKNKGKHGFFYRVPASTDVALVNGDVSLLRKEVLVAQFGAVASLPASLRTTNSEFLVKFFEASGALQKAEVRSRSVDPEMIAQFGEAMAQGAAGAYAARQAEKAAKPSKLERIKAEMDQFSQVLLLANKLGLPVPAGLFEGESEETGEE